MPSSNFEPCNALCKRVETNKVWKMSKTRNKRQKKKARSEEKDRGQKCMRCVDTVFSLGEAERESVFFYLKVQVLGPFLFGAESLCPKAVKLAEECELLPYRRKGPPAQALSSWPEFFEERRWKEISVFAKMVLNTVKLCTENRTFMEYVVDPDKPGSLQEKDALAERVQLHSGSALLKSSSANLTRIFSIIRTQVIQFVLSLESESALAGLRASFAERESLCECVRLRGNSYYKEGHYCAATADYSRAIKLNPFSAVLYSNRALSYLKSQNHWMSCVDGFRAFVLKPRWEKPYYTCAEAWYKLGNHKMALAINQEGVEECPESSKLDQQHKYIESLTKNIKAEKSQKKNQKKRDDQSSDQNIGSAGQRKERQSKPRTSQETRTAQSHVTLEELLHHTQKADWQLLQEYITTHPNSPEVIAALHATYYSQKTEGTQSQEDTGVPDLLSGSDSDTGNY